MIKFIILVEIREFFLSCLVAWSELLGIFLTLFFNKCNSFAIISNSDPKNTNGKDLFFDSLYSEYNIKRVLASRIINRNVEKRGLVSELLIKNF